MPTYENSQKFSIQFVFANLGIETRSELTKIIVAANTKEHLIFKTHILEKPLIDYIESIFHFKGFKPDHSIERVVPTGHVFIIFELDGFERHTYDNKNLKPNGTYSEVWVSGVHKN